MKLWGSFLIYLLVLPSSASAQKAPSAGPTTATQVTATSAILGGSVTSEGGEYSTRGIVWSARRANPLIGDPGATEVRMGNGVGSFAQTVTGLLSDATIHVRSYARNDTGTSYGSSITLHTPPLAGATILQPGDAMPLRVVRTSNLLEFVTLVELTPGTSLSLTDKGWSDEGAFTEDDALDGQWTWTVTETIPAGTIFQTIITDGIPSAATLEDVTRGLSLSSEIKVSDWLRNELNLPPIANSGDQFVLYQGGAASPRLVSGIHFSSLGGLEASGWSSLALANSALRSRLPGSTGGAQNALSEENTIGFGDGDYVYQGPISAATRDEWVSRLGDETNWASGSTAPAYGTRLRINQASSPKIQVKGNGRTIVNGDTTPSTDDGTDFGSVGSGNSVDQTFSILNLGPETLNLTGSKTVRILGTSSAFSVVEQPATILPVGTGSTTFTVRFTPDRNGTFKAALSIASDDTSENPYVFMLRGRSETASANEYPVFDSGSFNLSHARFAGAGSGFAFGPEITEPEDFAFSADGHRMFVLDSSNATVLRYDLTTPFDLSTATWAGASETLELGDRTADPLALTFDDVGRNLYILGSNPPVTYNLNVSINGSVGSVSVNPNQSTFFDGESVTLTASVDFPYEFDEWRGDASGSENPLTIIMDRDRTITANFKERDGLIQLAINDDQNRAGFIDATIESQAVQPSSSGGNRYHIVQYPLNGFFDPSQVITSQIQEFSLNSHAADPTDLFLNPENDRLFILVDSESNGVEEYRLNTPKDISTVQYAGRDEDFVMPEEIGSVNGIVFSADGRKMFVLSRGDRKVFAFELDLPFDVSTALWLGSEKSLSVQEQVSFPRGIEFSRDGLNLFLLSRENLRTEAYDLAIDPDITVPENTDNVLFDADATDGDGGPYDLSVTYGVDGTDAAFFSINSQGELRFVIPADFEEPLDADGNNVYELSIVAENDEFLDNFNTLALTVTVTDVEDAPEMEILGNGLHIEPGDTSPSSADRTFLGFIPTDETVDQTFTIVNRGLNTLNLTGDSAISFAGDQAEDFSLVRLPSETVAPAGGSTTFTVRFAPGALGTRTTTLSIASDDPTQGTYSFSIQGIGAPSNFPPVFDIGAFNLASARTVEGSLNLAGLGLASGSFAFNHDGAKLYLLQENSIVPFSLDTPYDLTTATVLSGEIMTENLPPPGANGGPYDFALSSDGKKIFVENLVSITPNFWATIDAYSLGLAFDTSTAVWLGVDKRHIGIASGVDATDPSFSTDGSKMFLSEGTFTDTIFHQFDLTEPFDVSTAAYSGAGETFNLGLGNAGLNGYSWSTDGTKLYIALNEGGTNGSIHEYRLSEPFDISTAVPTGTDRSFRYRNLPQGWSFSHDGLWFFISYSSSNNREQIDSYYLGNNIVSVKENSAEVLYDANASDGDGGETDANITYSLSGEDADLFAISASGEVTFLTPPDYEDPKDSDFDNVYHLTITADDGEEEFNLETLPLTVMVTSVSDGGPQIQVTGGGDLGTVNLGQSVDRTFTIDNSGDFPLFLYGDPILSISGAHPADFTILSQPSSSVDASGGSTTFTISFTPRAPGLRWANLSFSYNSTGQNLYNLTLSGLGSYANRAPLFSVPNATGEVEVSTAYLADGVEPFALEGLGSASSRSLAFSTDGTRMIILERGFSTTHYLSSYSLSTPFELSTALWQGTNVRYNVGTHDTAPEDIAFQPDGMKMFVLGSKDDAVIQYTLATPYDLSRVTYSGVNKEFSVGLQETNPRSLAFSTDGQKMFILGTNQKKVLEYLLTTAFDPSTATYAGDDEALFVGDIVGSPEMMRFNQDGTGLLLLDRGAREVLNFRLATPFDVSTAKWAGRSSTYNFSSTLSSFGGMDFATDGSKMFLIDASAENVITFSIGGNQRLGLDFAENRNSILLDVDADDGDGSDFDAGITYSVAGVDAAWFSVDATGKVRFNTPPDFENPIDADGNNVYELTIVADDGQNENSSTELFLSVRITNQTEDGGQPNLPPVFATGNFDPVSAQLPAGTFSINAEEANSSDIAFSSDGTRMLVLGFSSASVVEYQLTTPFDLATASYAGLEESFIFGDEARNASGMAFSADGSKLFLVGFAYDRVVEYSLSAPFDVSTASYAGANTDLAVASQESNPTGIAWSSDGRKLFVIGTAAKSVVEYALDTQYDLSTASYAGSEEEFEVGDQETQPQAIAFSADGFAMFITGNEAVVFSYRLAAPFDVSTAAYRGTAKDLSVSAEERGPQGLAFNPDGSRMFVVGSSDDVVVEYSLGFPTDFTFEENATGVVTDVTAFDGDSGAPDSSVAYSLAGDASLFWIDALGVITFRQSPDFENPQDADRDNVYHLIVTADDGQAENNTTSYELTITITDLQDAAPEIAVSGNGQDIANGDLEPSVEDDTDFGELEVGSTVEHIFTITNSGNGELILPDDPAGVISGEHPNDFSVVTQPMSPVAIGGSTTFTVRFAPIQSGTRSAILSIANNDGDESPFEFAIQGTANDSTPPTAPTNIDLVLASDSGLFGDDNLTNDNTPTFSGTAEPFSTVRLFATLLGLQVNSFQTRSSFFPGLITPLNGGSDEVGSTTVDASGQWTITTSPLNDGTYNITATATDASGNTSPFSESIELTIDTVPPTGLVSSLAMSTLAEDDTGRLSNDGITNNSTPRFLVLATEADLTVGLTSDRDGDLASGLTAILTPDTFGVNLTAIALSAGTHAIRAFAADLAGNRELTSPIAVVIDLSPPATPTITTPSAPTFVNTDTISIQGSAEANSQLSLHADADNDGMAEGQALMVVTLGPGETTFAFNDVALAQDSENDFVILAGDLAGNVSATAADVPTITEDSVAPTIAIGAPSLTTVAINTPVSFTVTYGGADTVNLEDGDVTVNTIGTVNANAVVSGSGTSTRTVTVTPTAGAGSFTISIAANTASDAAGNEATAAGSSASVYVSDGIQDLAGNFLTDGTPTGANEFYTIVFNQAPVIGGITTSTTIDDNATATPFASVTIDDAENDNVALTVSLDTAAKGAFTAASLTASGFTDGGSGVYSLTSRSEADAQTAIRQLVFDPAENRLAVGLTEVTTFTITANDGISSGTDNTTTVTATSVNDAPTGIDIAGGASEFWIFDPASTISLGTLSATDIDNGSHTFSIVSVNGNTSGTLFSAFEIVGNNLRVATPASVAPGTLTFVIRADDGQSANNIYDETLTNLATARNDLVVTVNNDDAATAGETVAANMTDGGGLSLREAFHFATSGSTITVDAGLNSETITLGSVLSSPGGITLNTGAASSLTIAGSTLTLGGGLTITNGPDDALTITAGLAGDESAALAKSGAGTLTLRNADNQTNLLGTTTVFDGTLAVANDGNLGSGTVILNGASAILELGNGANIDNAVTLQSSGGIVSVANGSATLSGIIGGSGAFAKTGGGALTLSGNNTYTGATTLSEGTLIVTHANGLGTTAGGTAVTESTVLQIEGGITLAEPISLDKTAALVGASGENHLTSNINILAATGNPEILAAEGATLTLSGVISGNQTRSILFGASTHKGTVVLSGDNTFANSITVNDGTLILEHDNALGATDNGVLAIVSGAVMALQGGITVAEAEIRILSNGLDGNGGLQSRNGDNIFSGRLRLAADTTIGVTEDSLTLSGVVTDSTSTRNLTKVGAGTLVMANTGNDYDGSTTVSAGVLNVTGYLNGTGAVSINSGSTLGGTGSISGVVTVNSGGTLAPGLTEPGVLTLNNNLTMSAGSTLSVQLDGAGAGIGYDQVVVNGTVDVSGATLLATQTGSPPTGSNVLTLIGNDGTDGITGTFSGLAENATFTPDGGSTFAISYGGGEGDNDLVLTTNRPPEAPVLLSPVAYTGLEEHGRTLLPRPKLFWSVPSDPEDNDLQFKVYLDTVDGTVLIATSGEEDDYSGFEVSTDNGESWAPMTAAVEAPYDDKQVRFTPASDLEAGTFFWNVVANDGIVDGAAPTVSTFRRDDANWSPVRGLTGRISKAFVEQLRQEINYLRLFRGLSATTWGEEITSGVTRVRDDHVLELREALQTALEASGEVVPNAPALTPRQTRVNISHFSELSDALGSSNDR